MLKDCYVVSQTQEVKQMTQEFYFAQNYTDLQSIH